MLHLGSVRVSATKSRTGQLVHSILHAFCICEGRRMRGVIIVPPTAFPPDEKTGDDKDHNAYRNADADGYGNGVISLDSACDEPGADADDLFPVGAGSG